MVSTVECYASRDPGERGRCEPCASTPKGPRTEVVAGLKRRVKFGRTAGELSRREGGKVFGAGSRNTVAITFLVKKPDAAGAPRLHYKDIGDYLSREEKLEIVGRDDLALIDWETITPNAAGDWINQRGDAFEAFAPLGAKGDPSAVFRMFSGGLKTNRDAWVYNSSEAQLASQVRHTVSFYNEAVQRYVASIDRELPRDSRQISWSGSLEATLRAAEVLTFDAAKIGSALYRPFFKQRVYYDSRLNERRYQLPAIFPTPNHDNLGFFVMAPRPAAEFAVLATDQLPDLSFYSYTGQFFPRWTWEKVNSDREEQGAFHFADDAAPDVVAGYRRKDNITAAILAQYGEAYGEVITADDVFFYVYGLLHSPDYRAQFAPELTKMLPRVPLVTSVDDFRAFVAAGRTLADLHVGYESSPSC